MSVRTTFKTGFVEKKKREKFDSKQKHEVHELLVLEMLIKIGIDERSRQSTSTIQLFSVRAFLPV